MLFYNLLLFICIIFYANVSSFVWKPSLHGISRRFQPSKVYAPRDPEYPNRMHSTLRMAFDTIVEVASSYESKCSLNADKGLGLTNYMQLPVEQYVCIKMPLDATLARVDGNRFNLTVPPVRFFNLDVSPTMICRVTQSNEAVLIESSECTLRGSPFVESLNGCFRMMIKTSFKWIDTPSRRSILSNSKIYVEVDPPAPFKYFGKNILEKTGSLALSIALRQIENAFVSSLSRDYEKWVTDKQYRHQRAGRFPSSPAKSAALPETSASLTVASETSAVPSAKVSTPSISIQSKALETTLVLSPEVDDVSKVTASAEDEEFLRIVARNTENTPEVLTDDMCLLPGEPIIRIEEAPSNSRRIYSGIDIIASVDEVWDVLTDYERLQDVVPSLVKNEVLYRYPDGGARLSQVGAARVLPGITFTAKTVLDVRIYNEKNPIPKESIASYSSDHSSKNQPLKRGIYPCPLALSSLPHRDITMQSVVGEGDFDHYQGLWRMQALPFCAPEDSVATRLTYAVEIKPKGFLPVRLIEGRIASDLKQNLEAIREFVEAARAKKMKALASSSKTAKSNQLAEVKPAVIPIVSQPAVATTTVEEDVYEHATDQTYLQDFGEPEATSKSSSEAIWEASSPSGISMESAAVQREESNDLTVPAETLEATAPTKPFSFRRMIKSTLGIDMMSSSSSSNEDSSTTLGIVPVASASSSRDEIAAELVKSNQELSKRVYVLEQELAKVKEILAAIQSRA
jgi:hypothetical protein